MIDPAPMMELRGLRVHNLQGIDLNLPLGRFIAVCGVSGSGKSSLAFDTLYAEGQRRYIESFSTYERQFLERFERPVAERIDHIPPAVAVRQRQEFGSRRSTVATASEIHDSLRLLYARLGTIVCPDCSLEVHGENPTRVRSALETLTTGTRFQIAFPVSLPTTVELSDWKTRWQRAGFTRAIYRGKTHALAEYTPESSGTTQTEPLSTTAPSPEEVWIVLDRLTAGGDKGRLADSLEAAFQMGHGAIVLLIAAPLPEATALRKQLFPPTLIDGAAWHVWQCHTRLICEGCRREFLAPEPRLFSFNSPLGACPVCQGTGDSADRKLVCPACHGDRLRPEALAVRVGELSLAGMCRQTVSAALAYCRQIDFSISEEVASLATHVLPRLISQLESLQEVGLGYLTLDRQSSTLSAGESRRVALTGALGSKLVNTLFVLDEPTAGLHAADTDRLIAALVRLRDLGNTLVVVEHDPRVLLAADWLVELGPRSGSDGGRIVFQGLPAELANAPESLTREVLPGRSPVSDRTANFRNVREIRRSATPSTLRLTGVRHRNIQNITVDFPLGVLCAVSGVSGSGKSSLVVETLYPALARALGKSVTCGLCGEFDTLNGHEELVDVTLVDPLPPGRSTRGNLLTLLGTFQHIRALFAGTADAKVLNFEEKHFGFNQREGGRCPTCCGLGTLAVDLHFLPDVSMTCPDCGGSRFRQEILQVKYRGLSIAEVLRLTVREAFTFFRGIGRVQRRLQGVRDVGLDYLTLGQPLHCLSGGELQRLKLASAATARTRGRNLFILDEPTIGLHPADVRKLRTSWDHLLEAGHSLIVIEHNLDVLRNADHLIDLGPGAGPDGGRIVAQGTPAEVAANSESVTGRYL